MLVPALKYVEKYRKERGIFRLGSTQGFDGTTQLSIYASGDILGGQRQLAQIRNSRIRSIPSLFLIRRRSWCGVAAALVEFGDALGQAATVCNGGFGAEDGWSFEVEVEVEDAERGEVFLNL
jgi:hypothetical protein